jgi:hypothetical protein
MSPSVPPPPDLSLAAHVAAADAALAGLGARTPTGALLRVSAPDAHPPDELACYPIDPAHPLEVLLGFVAPPHWWAIGVSSGGRSHPIADDGRVMRRPESPEVRITVLLDRSGHGTGLLRDGDEVTPMPGSPEGVVADACRRALGVATAAPPPTPVELWTRCWLDRVVDAVAGAARSEGGGVPGARSWREVTRLHPASSMASALRSGVDLSPDPHALADATRALAEAWPWTRLRAEPTVLDLPGPLPEPGVAAWMDGGMWARWLLAAFPSLDDLVDAARSLLPSNVARAVEQVVHASVGTAEPAPERREPT